MSDLAQGKCVPCGGGIPPLSPETARGRLAELRPGWEIADDNKKIRREVSFKAVRAPVGFVDQVAQIAETEGHHPDIHIFYNKVVIELTTHAIGGLSLNDFILAAKIDSLV